MNQTQALALAATALAATGVTPEMFGAVGDGTTNDRAALQRWLSHGGDLRITRAVTYRVSGTGDMLLLQNSNTTIRAVKGAQIVCDVIYDGTPATDVAILAVHLSGQALSNVYIGGLRVAYTQQAPLFGATKPAIYCQNVKTLWLVDCDVQYGNYGVFIYQCSYFKVLGALIQDTYNDGIQCSSAGSTTLGMRLENGEIAGNLVLRAGDDGIAVGSNMNAVGYLQPQGISIHHNNVRDGLSSTKQGGGGIGVYGVYDFEVSDNDIYNAASQCIAVLTDTNNNQDANLLGKVSSNRLIQNNPSPSTNGGVTGLAAIKFGNKQSAAGTVEPTGAFMSDVDIEDNLIIVNDRAGMLCTLSSRYDATKTAYPTNVRVRRNTIRYTGNTATTADWRGFYADRCTKLLLEGNEIASFPSFGTQVLFYQEFRMYRNRFIECVGSQFTANAMVQVGGNNAGETIDGIGGNEYRKTSGTVSALCYLNNNSVSFDVGDDEVFFATGATISNSARRVGANAPFFHTGTASAGSVSLSWPKGIVTTEALSTAAGAIYTLTLNNNYIFAGGMVAVTISNGTNTVDGATVLSVTLATGQAVIKIQNMNASAALNGTLKVTFKVLG